MQDFDASSIRTFTADTFGKLRIEEVDGKPMFCASDVANALGYSNPRDAVKRHCKGVVKRDIWVSSGITPHPQAISFIGEGDVYRLITHSKLPNAERFEHEVFDEILPSLRRDGAYVMAAPDETPEELIVKALTAAQAALERTKAELAEAKPKAAFADAVAASHNSILIRDMAKLLVKAGYETGQDRLIATLRNDGYMQRGELKPTQRAVEMGILELRETAISTEHGNVVRFTTKVTGKGQQFFLKKYAGVA